MTTTRWAVYVIDNGRATYTGATTDVTRRVHEHNVGTGARFTRGRGPWRTVFAENGHTQSSALRREAEIKRWTREKKLAFWPMALT